MKSLYKLVAFLPLMSLGAAPAPSEVWAIRGARIVPVSGAPLDDGTIVFRNGLIVAVGAGAAIPPEARVIDGRGLTVYPGLIDADTTLGMPQPENRPERPEPPQTAAETLEMRARGITPERKAANLIEASDPKIVEARKLGFTSAAVAPRDGVLVGQSAVVNLAGDKESMVVRSPATMHLVFQRYRGLYPTTLMGAMAAVRQSFLDASYFAELGRRYEKDPRGVERPVADPSVEALQVVQDGRLPLVVVEDDEDGIKRALRLGAELKVRLILAGGADAGAVAPLLKRAGVPVLVSADLAPAAPPSGFGGGSEARQPTEAERRGVAQSLLALKREGVPFALTTRGVEKREDLRARLGLLREAGFSSEDILSALTLAPARILGVSEQLGSLEVGKIANAVVTEGDLFSADAKIRYVFIDGRRFEVEETARRTAEKPTATDRSAEKRLLAPPGPTAGTEPLVTLFRGATVLTVKRGKLAATDVLVRDGTIAAVGKNLTAPGGARVIDLSGKYLMPGIIDSHSHMALEGGGNESASSVTPEVRIADVIRHDDVELYRALAGGVTTINVLHGSANVIGGQNAVLKLKWGRPVEELFVPGAPRGIKFALGENPKRSNRQGPGPERYPKTRMGVEAVLREAFTEARAYQAKWSDYEKAPLDAERKKGTPPPPPRRDLRLEALADILRGDIRVHAHCYRADEILMLLRVADDFGFKISTLQHVLEGYKVAKEIAAHGAGASTFADNWAYKMEAYDAIPSNAALMTDYGVRVSINSDSSERVRRLYQEAAKTMKYGGNTEEEALATITWNAAADLGLEHRIGSIEVGKDAVLPVLRLPSEREDAYDAAYAAPAELQAAGVRFAISTLSGADARNLPYHAAMAAAYGLPPEEALKAITLYPAEILGLEGRVGSLAPGKRADVVLARGDILDARTEVVTVYVGGKPVDMETHHTRLYEKWRKR